jgi:hypothetical protein
MIRAFLVALLLVAGIACGKYGPPVRAGGGTSAAAPQAAAAPAESNTEVCPDPNSPEAGAEPTP